MAWNPIHFWAMSLKSPAWKCMRQAVRHIWPTNVQHCWNRIGNCWTAKGWIKYGLQMHICRWTGMVVWRTTCVTLHQKCSDMFGNTYHGTGLCNFVVIFCMQLLSPTPRSLTLQIQSGLCPVGRRSVCWHAPSWADQTGGWETSQTWSVCPFRFKEDYAKAELKAIACKSYG